MTTLTYKANSEFVFKRLQKLYTDRVQDQIFAAFQVPSKTLEDFRKKHTVGPCSYPDIVSRAKYWDSLLAERTLIQDDSIPCAYMSECDQGLYGGMLGAEVEYSCFESGWISSMVRPILKSWSEIQSLHINKENPVFQEYLKQLRVFSKAAEGKFGISHLIVVDGLNFGFELFGATETYMGMYDHEEELRQVIRFAFDLNVLIHNTFFEHAPLINGGTYCTLAEWLPGGRIISESIDPFHMTSVDIYEKWGHENAQKLFDAYDGGFLHIHGNGRHLIEASSRLRGLKAIFLGDDLGWPKALDVLPDLKSKANGIPIIVLADYPEFISKLQRRELAGGVLYRIYNTPDIAAANRCYEDVLKYRI